MVTADEHLVVVAVQEAVAEPARERQFHLLDVARREGDGTALPGGIEGAAIVLGDVGHVLGAS